jgi:glycosyltransferase involved in cell wall biosynthesis
VQDLKISLITVTYNAQKTLERCIESVITQNYKSIEHIIIDGASTDGTLQIISKHNQHINIFVSEPDGGIYDAMNKGIKLATGNIIGILNADDFFATPDILSNVAKAFAEQQTDVLYGDLNYINAKGAIVRKWKSGEYRHGLFNWGWMPPHPTFYCQRSLFERYGFYKLEFGTAADYELMLRFIHANKASAYYLNKVMVNMVLGGVSNKNYRNRLAAWGNDYNAMRNNSVTIPRMCVIFKPLRKIFQYI